MGRGSEPSGEHICFLPATLEKESKRRGMGEAGLRGGYRVFIVLRCMDVAALHNVFEVSRKDVAHTRSLHCDTERAFPAAPRGAAVQPKPRSRDSLATPSGSTPVLNTPVTLWLSG